MYTYSYVCMHDVCIYMYIGPYLESTHKGITSLLVQAHVLEGIRLVQMSLGPIGVDGKPLTVGFHSIFVPALSLERDAHVDHIRRRGLEGTGS
jgi:hypothetical protein